MGNLIKFELKKIFQNKLCFAVIVLVLIGSLALTGYNLSQYKSGVRGEYALSDMDGRKMPEVFVSNENIEALKARLDEFEANDEIYTTSEEVKKELVYVNGVAKNPYKCEYNGKYEFDLGEIINKYEAGVITEEEYLSVIQNNDNLPFIRLEYLPEYFELYAPVKEYNQQINGIKELRETANSAKGTVDEKIYLHKAEVIEKSLEDGFTYGYDYGWESAFNSFSDGTISLLLVAVVIMGVCNLFSNEYSYRTAELIIVSKNGKKKTVSAKIIASVIYAVICSLVFCAIVFSVNFAFLGAEGMNVGVGISNLERAWLSIPFITLGCIIIALLSLAVSSLFSKPVISTFGALFIGFFPMILNFYVLLEEPLETLKKITPVMMICGNYITYDDFIVIGEKVLNIVIMFIPVSILLFVLTSVISMVKFCRYQVKN